MGMYMVMRMMVMMLMRRTVVTMRGMRMMMWVEMSRTCLMKMSVVAEESLGGDFGWRRCKKVKMIRI